MDTSERGRAFIRAHEGNPLTAYLDPVGVPTIGVGFTNASKVATEMLGKIVPGKTKITAAQSDSIFAAMLDREYEPKINMPGAKQHEFDCGASVVWNLGGGAMNWQWAKLWRAGKKKEAAAYLGSHYNTADGRKLPGLVRRRKEEAKLLEHGIYAGISEGVPREVTPVNVGADPVVKEAQEILSAKGFNPGAIDGWMGPKTRDAITAYQKAHPHLVNDGILGPATLSQLRRDAQAVKDAVGKGGGAVVGTGALSFVSGLPWGWIAAGVAVAAVAYFAWRYRDVIARRINTLRGKTVEV